MITIINRVLRNRVKSISFPKIPTHSYNKLWKITINKFIKLPITELVPIIRCLTSNYGASSLIAIPTIYWIIKKSEILQQKDTESHLKMFKALDVDNNNVVSFFKLSLIFSLLLKILFFIMWLLWLPLKIAIIFFILDYFNYDVSYIYYKLNNLSLGTLNWYYQTLIYLLESLRFKYDYYIINNEHIKKI